MTDVQTAPSPQLTQTDTSQTSEVPQRGWIRRLARECMAHPALVFLCITGAVIRISLFAAMPLVTKFAIDDAVAGRTDRLVWWALAMLGLQLASFGFIFIRRYFAGRLALDVQHDLRQKVFAAVSRLDGGKQDTLHTGQIAARAISDLQAITTYLMQIPLSVGMATFALVALGAMLWMSPALTVIALVILPLIAIVVTRSRKRLFPATWAAQQRGADIAQQVDESVHGVRVVKGFGQEVREVTRLEQRARSLFSLRLRSAKLSAMPTATTATLPAAGQIAVLLAGGLFALHGQISLGTFLAFASYVANLVGPARLLSMLLIQSQLTRASVERVYELIDAQPEITERSDTTSLPEGPLAVEVRDVRFGYTQADPVLNGLSLHARPGETLALVGTPGSGKSTISLLLPRFYDVHAGSIHIGSVDIRDAKLAELRKTIGVVFEEAFLFSASVRDNIAYGRPEASDDEVIAAAKAAQADEFIRALPQGYDTMIGERGLTLSGGQRQRLSLARALLTDPRILILDDATSAVDTVTEAAIHDTLKEVMAHRTTLLIAHRRSTLALANRIAVLDQGRVVDIGTMAELEQRCALFRNLISGPEDSAEHLHHPVASSGVTPELWPQSDQPENTLEDSADLADLLRSSSRQPSETTKAAIPAAKHGVSIDTPPTQELVKGLRKLPPATEQPKVDDAISAPADPNFRMAKVVRPVAALLAAVIALVGIDTFATLAVPALYQYGIDHGVQAGIATVLWAVAGLGALIVALNWLAVFWQTRLTARAGETMLYSLRVRSYAHLQRLGLDYYERELSGQIMTRMTTDVDALSAFLQTGLAGAVVSMLTLVGICIALLITDATLALYALTILPILIVATLIFRRLSSAAYKEARERVGLVNADLQENINGLRTAQAYTREEHSAQAFASLSDSYRQSRMRAQRYIAIYFPFITLLSGLADTVVLVAGTHGVANGTLSPGVLVAFLLYLRHFFTPIQQLSSVFDIYQQAQVGVRRISELLRTSTSVPVAKDPLPVPTELRGEVNFDAVHFAYPNTETRALDRISLRVPAGQTTALVGTTGAGKSTAVKLIARFYDVTEGSVRIDGVDIRDYDPTQLRARMGVVPQEAHLFSGTVADNIRYGRPSATDAEVEAAARAVGALPAVAALPDGFLQPVGERGKSLSAGQRQLVALARAELVQPVILLLDEATAALDPATEIAVLNATEKVTRNRTTFVVAHRLATAAKADEIVVLEHGRILERGSHDDLLNAGGHYARLWKLGVDPD